MNSSDILKDLFASLDASDYDKAAKLLDANFKFTGPMPEPVGKNEFLGFQKALHAAMPDFNHHFAVNWEGKTGEVRGELRVTGTHTRALVLPFIPKVNATNRAVSLPTERWTAYVADGEITSLEVEVNADSGFLTVLKQIGREDLADCLRTAGRDCRTIEEVAPLGHIKS